MKRRPLFLVLWLFAGLLALVLVLRIFVADLYRVESSSMVPTIFGGDSLDEWVLVRYEGPEGLERFDLAVAYSDVGELVVKRVVALPGETVQVLGGDLFIDGSRLEASSPRPALVSLFDSEFHRVEDEFEVGANAWSRDGDTWVLDGAGKGVNFEANTLLWRSRLDDGYLLPDRTRELGSRPVKDGALELELELLSGGGLLYFDLREEGDCFRASLRPSREPTSDGGIRAEARLERFQILANPTELFAASVLVEQETLAQESVVIRPGVTQTLHFSNLDNTLYFSLGESFALTHSYAANRSVEGASVAPGKTIGAQVSFGGNGLMARVPRIRILRDPSWTSQGEFGVERPLSLGPGEYFLLGDHSAESQDGRTWGATRASDLLGRPLEVIWPRDRARSLGGDQWRRVPDSGSSD